jgi:hypothetical protein
MEEEETELNNLKRSNNQTSDDNRPSWYSSKSENSYTQTTVYSQNPINNTESKNSSNKQDLQNDVAVNMKSNVSLSRRHSFAPLSSNQTDGQLNGDSNISTLAPQSAQNTEITVASKPNIFKRLLSKLPLFSQMRKTIKASLALLIAVIFILDSQTRAVTGESVLLVAIVVIFYFPVRTIGK